MTDTVRDSVAMTMAAFMARLINGEGRRPRNDAEELAENVYMHLVGMTMATLSQEEADEILRNIFYNRVHHRPPPRPERGQEQRRQPPGQARRRGPSQRRQAPY